MKQPFLKLCNTYNRKIYFYHILHTRNKHILFIFYFLLFIYINDKIKYVYINEKIKYVYEICLIYYIYI